MSLLTDQKKDNPTNGEIIGGCAALTVMLPLVSVLHLALDGWALSYLWLWFVANPFGVAALSISHCIGLSLLISFATRTGPDLKKDNKEPGETVTLFLVWLVCSPLVIVLSGWIIKTYFMA